MQFTAIRTNARIKTGREAEAAVRAYAVGFMDDLISAVIPYPPPSNWLGRRPYVRTYTLQRGWLQSDTLTERREGGALRYTVQNKARDPRGRYYAQWIHGPNRQQVQPIDRLEQGWKNIGIELERLGGRGKFAEGVQKAINSVTSDFRR
jgi:hypothetical protein